MTYRTYLVSGIWYLASGLWYLVSGICLVTPLRKGMIELRVTLRDRMASWVDALGAVLRRKSQRQIPAEELPEPRGDAEEALWQAMGWREPVGRD